MTSLINDATLRKLDRLSLVASRVRAGVMKGERRSTKHGTSIEFADYRDYVRGDDLRRVDWNVYARLERPYIKLLEEEEDLAVHILVDASRSMDWGEGDENKLQFALRLAAALGYIALVGGDRLTVTLLMTPPLLSEAKGRGPGGGVVRFGPYRGRGHALRLLNFLSAQQAAGETNLNAALRDYALAARRPGLAFLISDLFSPNGYREGLSALQARGYEVAILHLLAPDELDPLLAGDLRLMDVETGAGQEVTLDGSMRDLYRRRALAWRDDIEAHCVKRDVHYVAVETSEEWEEVILFKMRRSGLVK